MTVRELNAIDDRPSHAASRHDTLAESVVLLLAVTAIQRLVGFGRGVLFCRWLSPAELGQWDMAYGFLMLAAPLAVLGLPGSFGRYLEHYRARGQLRTFLRRTTVVTSGLALVAIVTIALAAPAFSRLVFGRPDRSDAVLLIATCLGSVILQHFLESLFTALRLYRVVTSMHFVQSVSFAGLAVLLLVSWRLSASSVIVAYGAACMISSTGALLRVRSAIGASTREARPSSHATFWPKLVKFAAWVWVINTLAGLFEVIDRYMLVHFGGLSAAQAMTQVGHYHSSRIVPLLLVSVSQLLASMITPHLSSDWEAGHQERVSSRLNLAVKLVAMGMTAVGVGIMFFSPVLFGVVFRGKFDGGMAVLPWTIVYCVWFGTTVVAQNYLWCAEKVGLCSLPFLLGLGGNVLLNLLLLPWFGLTGVVLATTAANGIALAMTLWLNRCSGMRVEAGTYWACAAPLVLGFGLVPGVSVCCVLVTAIFLTNQLLNRPEKQYLLELTSQYGLRVKQALSKRSEIRLRAGKYVR